jgi:hypothetical protein
MIERLERFERFASMGRRAISDLGLRIEETARKGQGQTSKVVI